MSREININRQLLGLEDILFGTGIVTQIRAGQTVNITRINAGNLPFDETRTLLQWAESVNLEDLGSMITELQAIYDNLVSISNVDDNLSLLNNIISNITVLQELHTNLSILQNVNSNITIITNVNTNLDILTSIYNNLSALVNIHTNLTSLLAIDTNMQQLLAIDTNLPELLSINTNIVPNITEILDVNNKAEQVALDKQVVESLASQVTMDKQDINTMKLAVETIYDTFDDRFLGAKDIDPLVDNDGNALLDGALYFNTLSNALKVYVLDITTWVTIPQIYLSSLLDVQLTSITTNSILTWNGAKWVNTTTPVFDSIKLTGTNYGVMSWNSDAQVPSITLNSDVDIDLGESLILVKNTTGSTILDGRVVMAIGSNGNSGNILVSLHSGLKADAKRTIGIATQNILNDNSGFVTKEGKVKGINTTGSIYGETWVDGDILYVKANGALTKVEPADTALKMPIAFVIHAHTHGTLYVRTTGIDENHDRDFINNLVDIHLKTAKTTLVDADEFITADSTSSWSLKKITWASIKTLLTSLFISKVTSTDNAVVRFNGTTGDVQDSGIRIDDAGNILINKLLGGVTTVSMTDGTGNTNLILPESGIVATTADINNISLSGVTAYHLLQGNLAVSNSTITQGFNTTLYTGNGTTQSINTGIDMSTQWGNTAEEKFGGLVWIKGRSVASDNVFTDTVRGDTKYVLSNTTGIEATLTGGVSFSSNGFSLGASSVNTTSATYASWSFQTTHRVSGTTNHGKAYTCHYNPFTGFTIVKYEGSDIAGHEIPHHLGRKLGFWQTKNLTNGTTQWNGSYFSSSRLLDTFIDAGRESNNTTLSFDKTNAQSAYIMDNQTNTSANQYILYGWANSYFDESNKLIGNYEIGVYQGTGVAGNKVKTRGKPAWLLAKRIDSTGNWWVIDNKRPTVNGLYANTSDIEANRDGVSFLNDGFTFSDLNVNENGAQYLYVVAYDTNANGGGSYYPLASDTANVQVNNALIPIAQGIDSNGAKNTILSKNETFSGITYTQGKNYPYYDALGNRGVSNKAPNYGTTNPANGGDFYNVLSNKWYTSAGVEITNGRNYLNHIVYADNDGGVLYVEELPKVEYKDIVKANEFKGKNACTAWVNFDGTTTPPTIRDSYNVSAVIRTTTGSYDVYFKEPMDNINYGVFGTSNNSNSAYGSYVISGNYGYASDGRLMNKVSILVLNTNALYNPISASIQIMGGKN